MGEHTHAFYRHVAGPLHRAHPQVKLAATLAFVVAVVATPRRAFGAFAADAAIVIAVAVLAKLSLGFIARRLLAVLPFLLFAAFLPFISGGDRVEMLGASLSQAGLWAAWNITIKALLGAAATIVLAATTHAPDLLTGLGRLRTPRVMTAVMGFMIRYLDLIAGEAGRMRLALESRGLKAGGLSRARAAASLVGTLFVRSFERGERIHLAMQSRGYSGVMPDLDTAAAPRSQWLAGSLIAFVAALATALSWALR